MTTYKYIDYNAILSLLRAFERPGKDIPGLVLKLWHILHHDEFALNQNPVRDAIIIKKILKGHVDTLEGLNEQSATIVRRRFLNNTVYNGREVADQLNMTERQLRNQQKLAIEHLTKIINAEEENFRRKHLNLQRLSLGTNPYSKLFGVGDFVTKFSDDLAHNPHYQIYILTGIGGIGKTSIAHSALDYILEQQHFHRVERFFIEDGQIDPNELVQKIGRRILRLSDRSQRWSTAELQMKLIEHLSYFPSIIFIDGIEEKIDDIVGAIKPLSQMARVLVTSRIAPSSKGGIFIRPVPRLDFEQACQLLQYELDHIHQQQQGFPISRDNFRAVYMKIGGNPLALQLIAGLSEQMPLDYIFDELIHVKNLEVTSLYQRIYARVWEFLDTPGRNVLICLALFRQNQVTADTLLRLQHTPHSTSRAFSFSELQKVIEYLRRRSLIELSVGEAGRPLRYGIHNLTRAFLHSAVIAWPTAWEPPSNYQQDKAVYSPFQFIEQGIQNWLNAADQLDAPNRSEDDVIKDLNSIVEILDLGLYWDETLEASVEMLRIVWQVLQRYGYFDVLEPQLIKAIGFLDSHKANPVITVKLNNRLGEIHRETGRLDDAEKLYNQSLQKAISLENDSLIAQTKWGLAENLINQNKLDAAETLLKDAYSTLSNQSDERSWLVAVTNSLGRIYLKQRNFALANKTFDTILQYSNIHDVDRGRILRNKSEAALGFEDFEQAEEALTQSISYLVGRSIEQAGALCDLANLNIHQHNFQQAIKLLEQAEKLVPKIDGNISLLSLIIHRAGYANLRMGNHQQAEAHMLQAIILLEKRQPGWPLAEALGILGETYLNSQQYASAISIYERTLKLKPFFPPNSNFEAEVKAELREAKNGLGSRLGASSPQSSSGNSQRFSPHQ
ncbi:MAG: tetratricopeptide repeat protein [Chloroflexota bacterium]